MIVFILPPARENVKRKGAFCVIPLAIFAKAWYNELSNERGKLMRRYLLPQGSNSYKANLHCHTTLSDGRLSPEEIRRVYMAKGYSIVAYTDHGVMADCSALETEGFLPLRGCEVEICADAPKGTPHRNIKCCHLCFIALDREAGQLPSLGGVKYTGASVSDLLQRARAAGFFGASILWFY